MNAGVAMVRAYLELNGYFTLTSVPVIASGRGGRYESLTDVDVLAVRFPMAGHVVARGRPGPDDDIWFDSDPELKPAIDAVDVIVAEVKEGRARLNDAARTSATLYAALNRVGCVPAEGMDDVVRRLRDSGEARVRPDGDGVASRIRLVAFGGGPSGMRKGYAVVSLAHVADFIASHLEKYHDILHPADLQDPVLGLLHLLRKLD